MLKKKYKYNTIWIKSTVYRQVVRINLKEEKTNVIYKVENFVFINFYFLFFKEKKN